MTYWIEVRYIPDYIARVHENMKKLFSDFQDEPMCAHFDITISDQKTLDEVAKDIRTCFEAQGCKVFEVVGGVIE